MGGHLSSPVVASEIKRFTQRYCRSGPLHPSLFSLSPSGVCHASDVTIRAVGSYIKSINDPTISPLFHPKGGTVSFLLHFPSRLRDSALRSTVSCRARTFLPLFLSPGIERADDRLVYFSSSSSTSLPLFRYKIRPQLLQKVMSLPDKS